MCDTIVVVRPDRVWFAKNSDRDPNEAQLLEWHPRRTHERGAMLRCTWIEVPQARETHAVLLSRPFWMWGAEIGANEHGVVIGNEAVFTKQPYAKTGLTGMDLLRLALERAASAEEAVGVITGLLETVGQGGGCGHEHRGFTYHNAYLIADPRRAYVLETAGKRFAFERVTGAYSISNGLTLEAFARENADPLRTTVAGAGTRRACTLRAAERAEAPLDLANALRSHGPGRGAAPRYRWHHGGLSAPCVHAGGRLASSQTTASWVSELRPGALRHWATGTAAPCTGLFKPVDVATPVDLGPAPTDHFDPATLWWRHERLHRAVARDPERLLPLYAKDRDALEAPWFQEETRPASADAFAEADHALATWTARIDVAPPAADQRPRFVRHYWTTRTHRARM